MSSTIRCAACSRCSDSRGNDESTLHIYLDTHMRLEVY